MMKTALLFAGLVGLSTLSVRAQIYTYTSDTGGSDWSSDTGWNTSPQSGQDAVLVFGAGTDLAAGTVITSNNNVADPFVLNALQFTYDGPATGTRPEVILTGGALNFQNSTGGTGPSLVLNATGTISPDTRPLLTIQNNVTLTNTLAVSGASTAILNGAIDGAGGIVKSGGGMSSLILTAANSFDGAVTVSGGVLEIQHSQGLGSTTGATSVTEGGQLGLRGGIVVTGETLNLRGSGTAGSTGNLQGALRNMGGNNEWAGTINVDSTTVTRIISSTGTLTLSGDIITTGTVANGLVFQGDGRIEVTGNISGNANITKSTTGGNVLLLSGTNSNTLGKLTISNGTVQFAKRVSFYGADTSKWVTANLSVADGKTIAFNVGGTDEFTAADIDIVKGAGASGGFAAGARLGLDTTNAAGGEFVYSSSIGNWGTGTNALTLTKLGANILTLSGANTYTGSTLVSAGTLRVTHDNALGTDTLGTTVSSGATLELSGGVTITGELLSLTGEGVSTQGALRSVNGHNTWAGNINANTVGILRVMAVSSTDSLTITGNVTTTGTHPNGMVFQGNGKITVTGNITGNGSVTRSSNGNGVLLFTGVNDYSGSTILSNGTLQIGEGGVGSITAGVNNSSATAGGTLAGTGIVGGLVQLGLHANAFISPGDAAGANAGTLTLGGGLTLNSTGGSKFKYNLGTESDRIVFTGGIFTGNDSGVTTFHFTPGAGFGNGIYDLIDWTALGGNVTNVEVEDFAFTGLDALYADSFFSIADNILRFHVVPEPARTALVLAGTLFLGFRRRRPLPCC